MKTDSRIYGWAAIVALGGFLFGFDTAVISGVEKAIQLQFQLSAVEHGFAIASALVGTVIGAIVAGSPADKYGRKPVLYMVAFGYAIASAGTALANNVSVFTLLRFVGGIAVGASSVVAPMYISEIAPARIRGKATAFFQLNVIVGILAAFISNYLLSEVGENAWRWMLAVLVFPSILYILLLTLVPESPRFLVRAGKKDKAVAVFKKIGIQDVGKEIADIEVQAIEKDIPLFCRRHIKPISIAFLVAAFNQFSGINAILYFAPRIFELSGITGDAAFFQPIIIGVTNALFTLLGLVIVDKVGRRPLLIFGSLGMAVCLGVVAYIFLSQTASPLGMVSALVGYIMFFAVSTGTVIWILISEAFPAGVRGKGQSFGSFVHWFFAAVITFAFPVIASGMQNGAAYFFTFFSIMMILQAIITWKYIPETKGKTLEEISRELELN